jgi:hypothetical protein
MKIAESRLRRIIREALPTQRGVPMVPVEWLTRAVLDDLGIAYMGDALPKTELGSVIWDMLHELGMVSWSEDYPNGTLPSLADTKIEQGSHFHRWIVLDAVNRAEAEPQPDARAVAAIEATKAWVADPTEAKLRDTYYAGVRADDGAEAAMDAAYAQRGYERFRTDRNELLQGTKGLAFAASAAFIALKPLAAYEYVNDRVTIWGVVPEETRMRFRVLAALDAVGILPAPKLQETL